MTEAHVGERGLPSFAAFGVGALGRAAAASELPSGAASPAAARCAPP